MKARPGDATGEGQLLRVRIKEPEKQGALRTKGQGLVIVGEGNNDSKVSRLLSIK